MNDHRELIQKTNENLRAGKIRLRILVRGNRLWAQGTLPPKPGSDRAKPYQQRFSLGLPATPAGIQRAEDEAKLLGAKIALGEFRWGDLDGADDHESVAFWLKKFEDNFWARRARTKSASATWATYTPVFKKLEGRKLTEKTLIDAALKSKPDSRSRVRYCMVLSLLGELAGIETSRLKALKGSYTRKSVEPRNLPTSQDIVETYHRLKHPGWKWIFGMIATYGLRDHEVFALDLSEFPKIYTHKNTKTGRRSVRPVPPDWIKEFSLDEFCFPNFEGLDDAELDFSKLGSKVSKYFYSSSRIDFNSYSLRHCYARSCFELGVRESLAARYMGHSLTLHTQTYRQFWEEKTFDDEYERVFSESQLANKSAV